MSFAFACIGMICCGSAFSLVFHSRVRAGWIVGAIGGILIGLAIML